MLQRIQTVYMALAVILLVLCCCMPLATFEPAGMGLSSVMYSLVLINGDGAIESYMPATLLVLVVIAEILSVYAMLGYKNRRSQILFCSFAVCFELLWIAAYAALVYFLKADATPHLAIAASFPLIAVLLTLMARRAIKKDEELVRSADRIR